MMVLLQYEIFTVADCQKKLSLDVQQRALFYHCAAPMSLDTLVAKRDYNLHQVAIFTPRQMGFCFGVH